MVNIFTASFSELVEMQFGTSVENAVKRALDLTYDYDDMVRLIALYRREQDPFLDVEDFVKRGNEMGVSAVVNQLKEIEQELQRK